MNTPLLPVGFIAPASIAMRHCVADWMRLTSLAARPLRCQALGWLFGLLLITFGSRLSIGLGAETPPANSAVDAMIQRARVSLAAQKPAGAELSLAAYALLKTGTPKADPFITGAVQAVRARFQQDQYAGTELGSQRLSYAVGVDAILLEAVGEEDDKPRLEAIASFIRKKQHSDGAWAYTNETDQVGDTSVTQYSILGLWATQRGGVEIPATVWERCAFWHLRNQNPDGGFSYRTNENRVSTNTMTVAGAGSLLVIRQMLFPDGKSHVRTRSRKRGQRYGILEPVEAAPGKTPAAPPPPELTLTLEQLDESIRKATLRMEVHLDRPDGNTVQYRSYYLYGIERMGALLDTDLIGPYDWYPLGCELLQKHQQPNSMWGDSSGDVPGTSLALLFLGRATESLVPKNRPARLVDGGLLIGGRGLPDKLASARVKNGDVQGQAPKTGLGLLLSELSSPAEANVADERRPQLEEVDLSDPTALIGQIDRLRRLAVDPRPAVRETAMWAIGRSSLIEPADVLIAGLSDAELAVAKAASVGLCTLARQPGGIGVPIDPQAVLPANLTNEQQAEALTRWRQQATKAWNSWYFAERPYATRDDRHELGLRPERTP